MISRSVCLGERGVEPEFAPQHTGCRAGAARYLCLHVFSYIAGNPESAVIPSMLDIPAAPELDEFITLAPLLDETRRRLERV